MKINLTDEDLAERTGSNYFEEGEHEVLIQKATRGTTDSGKDYVEFEVLGHNDEQDTARVWLTTEKSCKYALSILAGIATHNKHTEAEKQAVRDAFKKITDTDQVDDKFLAKFKEMDAFFTVYKSDRTYQGNDGTTKYSYDKNIYGYMPSPRKPKQMTVDELMGTPASSTDIDAIPFA
jgi:hypothetical protein